ncbi:MAG: hypothetical protein A3I44_06240 [Candidatus Sungbacteria bacterium RIFCSPLOWO2_02_FULL_51_17]|uniref:Uncharacterized protein n=1 Tax=Candidatus Sungbacteria bacterium RIFCSPHIGHO2_02_FULL_51_29 TaxID=1802273 RepID=A0A1G2KQS7_9BACT|nr:MAG: hypothetical protein A2676_04555 [Candidatus Sungbacteria bacterium RIFCSPHIGHO2_01_FULL_51_22]OHA01624.1 MAG: hypothetical protein A3C16_02615 [Candidatus Sungbacteria bacterium RIFCSPHIGHO2_02_FULL_51_29]OHA06436.1 MAG: hypothetical protein A3B29_04705 [Candidatus Sungbacteria bacterium RIFCSPLOWO2_01_FULL_51_34]OHA10374.1 MAG: hypothetical protein A3I44_06240 [Candidatus Sungbacteria bacterium RIFCSPLOWO2_02_FULL_51_17]
MEHFVCRGSCGGSADHAKKCEDPTCQNFGKELEKCACKDSMHRASEESHATAPKESEAN